MAKIRDDGKSQGYGRYDPVFRATLFSSGNKELVTNCFQ